MVYSITMVIELIVVHTHGFKTVNCNELSFNSIYIVHKQSFLTDLTKLEVQLFLVHS